MSATELMVLTVGGLLAWLTSFGVPVAVAYVLSWMAWLPETGKQVIQIGLTVLFTAFLAALAQSVPQHLLDQTVFATLVGGFTAAISYAGVNVGRVFAQRQQMQILALSREQQLTKPPVWAASTMRNLVKRD